MRGARLYYKLSKTTWICVLCTVIFVIILNLGFWSEYRSYGLSQLGWPREFAYTSYNELQWYDDSSISLLIDGIVAFSFVVTIGVLSEGLLRWRAQKKSKTPVWRCLSLITILVFLLTTAGFICANFLWGREGLSGDDPYIAYGWPNDALCIDLVSPTPNRYWNIKSTIVNAAIGICLPIALATDLPPSF